VRQQCHTNIPTRGALQPLAKRNAGHNCYWDFGLGCVGIPDTNVIDKLIIKLPLLVYSFLRAFTGLVHAARRDSKLIVMSAISNAPAPADKNTEKSSGVL
jgi:hypothetical protein